jgi:sugar/nucleoside kinase (ribokinase family)
MMPLAMPRRPQTILGVGRPELELLGGVRHLPERGARAALQQFSIQGSGNAATTLVALCAWGYRGRFAGKVSDDPFGALIRETFRVPGMDAKALVTEPDRLSPFAFVAVPDSAVGTRTVYSPPGPRAPPPPRAVPAALLDGCAALVVDGSEPQAQLAMARRARRRGIPCLLHASRFDDALVALLEASDLLVVSERLAAEVAPRATPEESAVALHALGPKAVVITMGVDGCAAFDGAHRYRRGIQDDLPVVDRVGAGAVFAAALLHGTLSGWSFDRRLDVATAAAGLACGQLGPQAGIPPISQAEAIAYRR